MARDHGLVAMNHYNRQRITIRAGNDVRDARVEE